MSDPTRSLADLWKWFAEAHFRRSSPLYERIALGVANDRDVLELQLAARPAAHLPPVLLAAVHYLLLEGLEHPLAEVYGGRSNADPAPLFLELCRDQRHEMEALLDSRDLQTNDCGRSAIIGPGLTWIDAQFDAPLAMVDVGASVGLNLLCDRYRLDYGSYGSTGPLTSPVEVRCRVVSGAPPIAERLPRLATRVGIDRSPIDLSNPDDARWLLACVWPDGGRLERMDAAIRLAQRDPPLVIPGDANEILPVVLRGLDRNTVAIVVTTWSFAYFTIEQRREFLRLLEIESQTRPVAWLSAEGTGVVETFAGASDSHDEQARSNVLGLVTLEHGVSRQLLLGYVHQHGAWIDWRGGRG